MYSLLTFCYKILSKNGKEIDDRLSSARFIYFQILGIVYQMVNQRARFLVIVIKELLLIHSYEKRLQKNMTYL